eukprot:scaffold232632_cov18-Tisochrysis_lutea.AAC.1
MTCKCETILLASTSVRLCLTCNASMLTNCGTIPFDIQIWNHPVDVQCLGCPSYALAARQHPALTCFPPAAWQHPAQQGQDRQAG